MQTIQLIVRNKVGLHARPAATLVRVANQFKSAITVQNLTTNTQPVNAKSILMLLSLGAEKDHTINIAAQGPDETEAIAALQGAVDTKFGEPE
jgi:phosphotransferase system HPr (HPr) family protein